MKKTLALILALAMSLTLLTSCASDPVADELEKFVNTDLAEVNPLFQEIVTEAASISEEDDANAMLKSLNETLIPKCDKVSELLSKITLETEEVKALRDKFASAIALYKEGFELYVDGLKTDNVDTVTKGTEKLADGVELINEYNEATTALAEEKGFEYE